MFFCAKKNKKRKVEKTGNVMNPKIGTSYASACDENLGDYFSRCFDLLTSCPYFKKIFFCSSCILGQMANFVRYICRAMLLEPARDLRWCSTTIHLML